MVTATYEHLVIILLVGVIFVGTVVALPAINNSTFQSIDQQQLKNIALNVLNTMLLGVGSPANWGSDPETEIEEMGLAYSSPLSKYVLDSDKVQRLDPDNPYPITREQMRGLLNLQGYGFNFSLYRPFTAETTLNIVDDYALDFSVTVTRTQDEAPIPNAKVRATHIVTGSAVEELMPILVNEYLTNATGIVKDTVTTDFTILSAISVLEITVAGMKTTVVVQSNDWIQDYLGMNTFGNDIVISTRDILESGDIHAVVKIIDGWAYKSGELFDIPVEKGKITFGEGHETHTITYPDLQILNPSALIIKAEINLWGDTASFVPVYIVGPYSLDSAEEVFNFGYEPQPGDIIVTARRFVVISDMTYIADIALWKENI
jgi:hypothetical protein